MSELFTQTDKQKKLFRTEEDIVANIQTQFGMPHTGKDLLLDAKLGQNKDRSSRLDSEPDAPSDTGIPDDVGASDAPGILHDSAGSKNTITDTNTPRASRASAYYDLLRSQHKNGHYKAPAYRVVDAMDWEELYDIVDGIKSRATGSGMTEEELQRLFASLNIDPTTARGQVVAFALGCQGKFIYAQPSSLRGGPGNPSVGINLDCSSFVQYCYWAQNLPFSAGSTAAYRNAADLVSISPSVVQPGDLRVVYASGGEQGHVQMALGGGAWIECCYGYGVALNMSNAWMVSRPCYYFRYAGF